MLGVLWATDKSTYSAQTSAANISNACEIKTQIKRATHDRKIELRCETICWITISICRLILFRRDTRRSKICGLTCVDFSRSSFITVIRTLHWNVLTSVSFICFWGFHWCTLIAFLFLLTDGFFVFFNSLLYPRSLKKFLVPLALTRNYMYNLKYYVIANVRSNVTWNEI